MTALREAVANLIKVKGRHNTEVAYQRLIEAYDAALAQPEQKPVAQVQVAEDYYPHVIFLDGVDTASLDQKFLYTAPPQQPKQRPVAYLYKNIEDYEKHVGFECNDAFIVGWNMARTTERMLSNYFYTTPPQREVYCGCGDEIVAGDGARCGTCVAVKYKEKEWPTPEPVIQARKEGNLIVVDLPQVPRGSGGITKDEQPELRREWQGLTDEEIERLFVWQEWSEDFADYEPVARAIEAKLREKNT